MQYAAAMNNTRNGGGSIGRQGRVSFVVISKNIFILLLVFLIRDINSNIVSRLKLVRKKYFF
jgi:hypothetical protein